MINKKCSKPVSLYIHIPFCKRKCDYCDFFSIPCEKGKIPEEYLSALKNEVAFYQKRFSVPYWKTVYIGGGTPSLLTPEQLSEFVSFTVFGDRQNSDPNGKKHPAEITVEFNPDDITRELLEAAENAGVTRLSVGIQVLYDDTLNFVHRRCSTESSLKALTLIRKYWHNQFSADLISGLPLVNDTVFRKSLESVVSFNPNHISLYSLTVGKGTALGKIIDARQYHIDQDKADEQWILGRKLLEEHGYFQYEVSNFALKGYESLHNLNYWDLGDYIGCGAGASGTMYSCVAEKRAPGLRWTNDKNIKKYINFWTDQGNMPAALNTELFTELPCETEHLDALTIAYEFFMMGLRKREGICLEDLKAKIDTDYCSDIIQSFERNFDEWKQKKLAENYSKKGKKYYALTENGILFLNRFLVSI